MSGQVCEDCTKISRHLKFKVSSYLGGGSLSKKIVSFSVTFSISCRKTRMSFEEGVRDSSLEFNMLSSSWLVRVFIRVEVKGVRGVEGI